MIGGKICISTFDFVIDSLPQTFFQKCPFQTADPIAYSSVWEIQYSGLCSAPCIDPHSTRSLLSNLSHRQTGAAGPATSSTRFPLCNSLHDEKEIPNLRLWSSRASEGRCWSGVTDENQGLGPFTEEFACPTHARVSVCVRVFVWVLSRYSGFLPRTTIR